MQLYQPAQETKRREIVIVAGTRPGGEEVQVLLLRTWILNANGGTGGWKDVYVREFHLPVKTTTVEQLLGLARSWEEGKHYQEDEED
jgi:hypothetical protein